MQQLERGHIVAVELLDPQQRNPKIRPVILVTPTEEIEASSPCFGVAITGQLPRPLTDEYVLLPFHPGPRGHPRTGLKKRCAAKCDWLVPVSLDQIVRVLGRTPTPQLNAILAKLKAMS